MNTFQLMDSILGKKQKAGELMLPGFLRAETGDAVMRERPETR